MYLPTSYFYQIRFFKPYMVPFSTAVWDPKWYHDFKGQNYNFVDKNGVLNGLRISTFRPNSQCDGLCRGPETCKFKDPNTCLFLQVYQGQISGYSKESIEEYFTSVGETIKTAMKLDRDILPVLIVHEPPQRKCSERTVIHKVLNSIGIDSSELRYPIEDNY